MPDTPARNDKISASIKGLQQHLREGEYPVQALPAIWDAGQGPSSTPCDVILTNQRIIGYYMRSFPRERVFFDALELASIKSVTLRDKKYEPVFRELLLNDGARRVYIRAPRKKIASLYDMLRQSTSQEASIPETPDAAPASQADEPATEATVYGREDIRGAFDTSVLAVLLLFVGGVILEILGVVVLQATQSAQAGYPLIIAGFVAVITAIIVRRQQRRRS